MTKIAVKSKGVGVPPELWIVGSEGDEGADRADFFVDKDVIRQDWVVAEGGRSLRAGTREELNPVKTNQERFDTAFRDSDFTDLLLKILLDHENRLRSAESKPEITMPQLKQALRGA